VSGDRLLNRARLSGEHPIRIDDDTEARMEVEQARILLNLLEMHGDGADQAAALRKAKARLKRAEAKVRACYEFVQLRAMEPAAFETLIGQHKPRPGTEDQVWNLETFPPAVLLACVQGDRSPQDWEHILAHVLSTGERRDLCNAAIRLNLRTPDASLPKGWMSIED
jgi:hypothetical protein